MWITTYQNWLVVSTILKNDGVRQWEDYPIYIHILLSHIIPYYPILSHIIPYFHISHIYIYITYKLFETTNQKTYFGPGTYRVSVWTSTAMDQPLFFFNFRHVDLGTCMATMSETFWNYGTPIHRWIIIIIIIIIFNSWSKHCLRRDLTPLNHTPRTSYKQILGCIGNISTTAIWEVPIFRWINSPWVTSTQLLRRNAHRLLGFGLTLWCQKRWELTGVNPSKLLKHGNRYEPIDRFEVLRCFKIFEVKESEGNDNQMAIFWSGYSGINMWKTMGKLGKPGNFNANRKTKKGISK